MTKGGSIGWLYRAGGALTGFLTLHADPTAPLHAATKQYVDGQAGLDELRAVTRTELGADLVLVANTDTTVVSQALTMPASGGPWRVMAWWSALTVGAGTTNWQGWVDDQQGTTINIFADGQWLAPAGTGGHGRGGISKQTYANGAAITLLLRVRATAADTVKATPLAGPAQIKTYLQTLVVKD